MKNNFKKFFLVYAVSVTVDWPDKWANISREGRMGQRVTIFIGIVNSTLSGSSRAV